MNAKEKANNFRWKNGESNVKASAFMKKSMYDADEVVRLMTEFAQSEVKKFHKRADVSRRSEQLFCDCEIKGSSFQLDTGEICCCKCEKERAK